MDIKKLNKMVLDALMRDDERKATEFDIRMWAEDTKDDHTLWVLSNYGAYRMHKAQVFVALRDDPMGKDGRLVNGIHDGVESAEQAIETGITRKMSGGITATEFKVGDTSVWVDEKLLEPLNLKKYAYNFKGTGEKYPIYALEGDDVVAYLFPVRM